MIRRLYLRAVCAVVGHRKPFGAHLFRYVAGALPFVLCARCGRELR